MATFYASIRGNRGAATRLGHKSIEEHIRGWYIGCKVEIDIDEAGRDRVRVYRPELIAEYVIDGNAEGIAYNSRTEGKKTP